MRAARRCFVPISVLYTAARGPAGSAPELLSDPPYCCAKRRSAFSLARERRSEATLSDMRENSNAFSSATSGTSSAC